MGLGQAREFPGARTKWHAMYSGPNRWRKPPMDGFLFRLPYRPLALGDLAGLINKRKFYSASFSSVRILL